MNATRIMSLLLPVLLAGRGVARGEEAAESSLPARPLHLEARDAKRWDVTMTVREGPFHGVVYYAVPPDDRCQTILGVDLHAETRKGRVEAVRVTDAGRYKKPLLKLELNAATPCIVVAHVQVQFHQTKLETGAPRRAVKPPGRGPLREYLDDGWPNADAREWFTHWMQTHQLMRGKEEEKDAFAFRVLKFIQAHFRYVIPDDLPEHQAMVARDPQMGDWRYTLGTFTGECWRLSDTYCRVMRMNGIPARLVSGNYIIGDKGHHLRSLVWLADAGWIPVEATAAVSSPQEPALNFFGTWGPGMLVGNRNIDFELPGPKGSWNIGTLDGLAFGAADGSWDFPKAKIQASAVEPK